MADYDAQKAYLPDESGTEQWKRVEEWVKKNKPAGANAQWVKWEKVYFQLERCQREWIGYRPACCGDRSKPIAVPIGCNHRLCPLCAHHRSHKAQANIKTMFDRLTHPIFVTLTIPNTKTLRKHDFTLIRQRVRKFIAEHKRWFKGGVYSLETTYNRREKTWHLHVHILADADCPLPSKSERRTLAGNRLYAFTKLKLELEFDWLRLWTGDWSKPCRMDSGQMRHAGDVYQFEQWYRGTLANKVREWDYFTKSYKRAAGLSDAEFEARTEWNRRNRRMVHIRPVDDRDKAAAEVLKYITKGAQFSDSPDAIEEFMDAVKGARLIQTFGTWYGAKFDTVFDPEHMDDWGEMKCACGLNHWERMGVFYRKDVYLEADGRWRIRSEVFNRHIGGTVPRPTIRALEPEGEATGYDINGIKFFAQ
ncbi:MAG TPA: protein rep [Terracidiphilus sp.]|nr:protein rep [Terracidiphilus sp.]